MDPAYWLWKHDPVWFFLKPRCLRKLLRSYYLEHETNDWVRVKISFLVIPQELLLATRNLIYSKTENLEPKSEDEHAELSSRCDSLKKWQTEWRKMSIYAAPFCARMPEKKLCREIVFPIPQWRKKERKKRKRKKKKKKKKKRFVKFHVQDRHTFLSVFRVVFRSRI